MRQKAEAVTLKLYEMKVHLVVEEVRVLSGHLPAGAEPDLAPVLVDPVDRSKDILPLGDRVLDGPVPGVDQVKVPPAVGTQTPDAACADCAPTTPSAVQNIARR